MGVVSRRWMWVESMGVASGCGCKEVYRFPLLLIPIYSCISSFLLQHPVNFLNVSFLFLHFFVMYVIIFSRSINTHAGDYGRPTAAI